jgi:hypothetical protein
MRHLQYRKKPQRQPLIKQVAGIAFGVLGFAIAGFYSAGDLISPVAATAGGCVIKGNVSINSRERIYHVPGQEYYASTKISPEYSERWFCSEAEARAAGWRKAGR